MLNYWLVMYKQCLHIDLAIFFFLCYANAHTVIIFIRWLSIEFLFMGERKVSGIRWQVG